ncbi:MAG: DUF2442 domain-containing protein [Treponema sp.]|nr:DUF2442 domain-containing protein [Treponema sp.]
MTSNLLAISQANYLDTYRVALVFDDGTERVIDFAAFLQSSTHPDIRKWLDPEAFRNFRIEYGDLVWGDWELCFPIADLYEGTIDHLLGLREAG